MNSKQKGKRGELELAHWLTDRGYPARRGQQFKGTPDSPDIVCESLGDIHIECKRVETFNAYKALEQAKGDASSDQTPAVFHRRNGKDWVVVVSAEDFLKFLR